MHTDDLIIPGLDVPVEEIDILLIEFVFEEMPEVDDLLSATPTVPWVAMTAGQTLFSERISIRIPRWLLLEIKKRAAASGERYQTYINLILAQHAATSLA